MNQSRTQRRRVHTLKVDMGLIVLTETSASLDRTTESFRCRATKKNLNETVSVSLSNASPAFRSSRADFAKVSSSPSKTTALDFRVLHPDMLTRRY